MSFREEKYEEWVKYPDRCRIDFEDFVKKDQIVKISEFHVWIIRHLNESLLHKWSSILFAFS